MILKIYCICLVLASNLCFNVEDGAFIMRIDLADAPMCALVRGASVSCMGEYQHKKYHFTTWIKNNFTLFVFRMLF